MAGCRDPNYTPNYLPEKIKQLREAPIIPYRELQQRVTDAGAGFVVFSIFKTVKEPDLEHDEWFVTDFLDFVAVEDEVKFVEKTDGFWGEGKDYESPVVKDPTWLQVTLLADEMIRTTGDKHHIFLEAIREVEPGVYEFRMGS